MEGGLQEEPVEDGVSIPSPQLTQQAASIVLIGEEIVMTYHSSNINRLLLLYV